jgi:uncharacterized membrane protein YgcG
VLAENRQRKHLSIVVHCALLHLHHSLHVLLRTCRPQKMERRASELNQAVRSTQDQAQALMSRFGWGSSSSGSQQEQGRLERERLEQDRVLEQQRSEQRQRQSSSSNDSKSSSGSSSSEGGPRPGFLSRMFGRGGGGGGGGVSMQEQQQQKEALRVKQVG